MKQITVRAIVATALLGTVSIAAEELEERVTEDPIQEVRVHPSHLVFSSLHEGRSVVVTGVTSAGAMVDLTSLARIEFPGDGLRAGEDGYFYPTREGESRLRASMAGQSVEIPVSVKPLAKAGSSSFVREVLPVINKVGCTNGICHGAAKGKNGFKLSLRGYSPEFDYQSLLYDMSGRRFNRADPAQSLMLAKPTQQVAHGGGRVLEIGSRYYDTLLNWIAEGVPFGDPATDRVERIEVLPDQIFMYGPGKKHRVLVVAHYPGGAVRDVTREAHLTSTSTSDVRVTEDGQVEGLRKGESSLLVRYEGKFLAVPVTVLNPRPGFQWKQLPHYNFIDELIDAKLKKLKLQPSPEVSDAGFLRRATLDLTGQIPPPRVVRAFLSDTTETHTKRSRVVDELIGSREYVDYWALKWGDLLRSNRKFMTDKGMWTFRRWLQKSIAENQPYDEFVRELLTARGSTFDNPAGSFFRAARDPKAASEASAQLFMGVRLVCAQCHDHPFEKWTQDQYYQMAAFFSAVGIRPGFRSGEEVVYEKRYDNEVRHPRDGRVVKARFLVDTPDAPALPGDGDLRAAFAGWLTSPRNPFFAQAIANRVWSYFLGRGIIHPVDDIRASNPPINPALLEALTRDFVEHGFDLQHLMRTIVNSRTYQTAFQANSWNQDDHLNFSHQSPRRLGAEQLADAISAATESAFQFPEVPEGFSAVQLPDPHVGMDGFLDLFGRPQREDPCECERKSEMSLPQAMNLVNGPILANAVADPEGRVARLILEGTDDPELVEELYVAALGRPPSSSESQLALEHLDGGKSRATAAQDLLWALLNSNGFLFNQ